MTLLPEAQAAEVLGIRKACDLGINVRPAKIFPGLAHASPLKQIDGVDMVRLLSASTPGGRGREGGRYDMV